MNALLASARHRSAALARTAIAVALGLVAGWLLLVTVPRALDVERAFAAAGDCPVAEVSTECRHTVAATVTSTAADHQHRSTYYWLGLGHVQDGPGALPGRLKAGPLKRRPGRAVPAPPHRVKMDGRAPVFALVRPGAALQLTYWRGEIRYVEFRGLRQYTTADPRGGYRLPLAAALFLLSVAVACLRGAYCEALRVTGSSGAARPIGAAAPHCGAAGQVGSRGLGGAAGHGWAAGPGRTAGHLGLSGVTGATGPAEAGGSSGTVGSAWSATRVGSAGFAAPVESGGFAAPVESAGFAAPVESGGFAAPVESAGSAGSAAAPTPAAREPWRITLPLASVLLISCFAFGTPWVTGGVPTAVLLTAIGAVPVLGGVACVSHRRRRRTTDTIKVAPLPPSMEECFPGTIRGDVPYCQEEFGYLVAAPGLLASTPDPFGLLARCPVPRTLTVVRVRPPYWTDPGPRPAPGSHVVECRDGTTPVYVVTEQQYSAWVLGALRHPADTPFRAGGAPRRT
ncbi:hypothetical protein [Streptomyces hundungensis]|uniref:hypothetical protein n=1 Tax=Streptomyces hundungensis TaxID=1077946 RepID=UPI0031EE7F2A